MSDRTRRPTIVASATALVAALVAVSLLAASSSNGLVLGVAGLACVVVGLQRGSHAAHDVGCLVVFFGVVAAGVGADVVETTLVAAVATVVAWDTGGSAIDLGEQLGREAKTRRLEIVHAASTVLVGLSTVTIGYALYVSTAGGQPIAALFLLLLAATLVTVGLGTRRRWSTSRRSASGR